MLVFATSGKGGTGRSVTSGNLAYRHALRGYGSCYVDFDFGSPTSGVIFDLPDALSGVDRGGLHTYLAGGGPDPRQIDVWSESQREALRRRPPGTGRLTLVPGDIGGSEFSSAPGIVGRCSELFQRLDEEYELILVDLSAGRSYASEIVLAATALPALRDITARWLVFHRWTRQHIVAAGELVYGRHGILDTGVSLGHDRATLSDSICYVRTAVPDSSSPDLAGMRPEQLVWLDMCNMGLRDLASRNGVGRPHTIGEVPFDPVLQWQEQLISNEDVWLHRTANELTVAAFEELSEKIVDDQAWGGR